jgi:hypothetical protein
MTCVHPSYVRVYIRPDPAISSFPLDHHHHRNPALVPPSHLHTITTTTTTITATVSVAPFSSGDCATQWYNAAFTLHALAADADAVVLRDNDQLLRHHLQAAVAAGSAGARNGPRLAQQRAASKVRAACASRTILTTACDSSGGSNKSA